MSIRDAYLILSEAQALTATADSQNVIDFGAGLDEWLTTKAKPEFYDGSRPLWLNVVVSTELDSAGDAATLTLSLMTGAAATCTTTAYSTAAIAEANCGEGAVLLSMPLPKGLLRYCKLTYTVAVENFTSGVIEAWIGLDPAVTK